MNKKYLNVIGCFASFNKRGIMNIYSNGKMLKFVTKGNAFMLIAEYRTNYLIFTADGFSEFIVLKTHCKII